MRFRVDIHVVEGKEPYQFVAGVIPPHGAWMGTVAYDAQWKNVDIKWLSRLPDGGWETMDEKLTPPMTNHDLTHVAYKAATNKGSIVPPRKKVKLVR